VGLGFLGPAGVVSTGRAAYVLWAVRPSLGGAVDVKRAADLYAQGWTVRTSRPQPRRPGSCPRAAPAGTDANAEDGDRTYLVLAKPNVIMNDTRLRGLAVAGGDAAGRKIDHNRAQTARNLRRSLRNSAAGARLIQPEGLDSQSAADLEASLADALEELHRLQRSLDRRIKRDQGRSEAPPSQTTR
jgi:hypothetical protein